MEVAGIITTIGTIGTIGTIDTIDTIETIIGIGRDLRKSWSRIQISSRSRFRQGRGVLRGLVINMLPNGWRKIPKN